VERIDFCEVLKDPREYGGKEITVRATYFYWFEMSDLSCLSCQDKGKPGWASPPTWTVIQKANWEKRPSQELSILPLLASLKPVERMDTWTATSMNWPRRGSEIWWFWQRGYSRLSKGNKQKRNGRAAAGALSEPIAW